jgi:pullulanase/glycogen debranching enzyme
MRASYTSSHNAAQARAARDASMPTLRSGDPLWYKDAVFYQLHVKSFADSNADGIGDFRGLTSKLDHLASLGVDCLWLQPMYPWRTSETSSTRRTGAACA